MSLPNQIIVSGAGTEIANGNYFLTNLVGAFGSSIWTKNGLDSNPRIFFIQTGTTIGIWSIGGIPFPMATLYSMSMSIEYSPSTENPTDFEFSNIGPFGSEPTPNVVEFVEESPTPTPTVTPSPTPITQPLSPVEQRNAKYQTENESGSNRFRRLVGLGYV